MMKRSFNKSKGMRGLCLSLGALLAVSGAPVYAEDIIPDSGTVDVVTQYIEDDVLEEEVILDDETDELDSVWEGGDYELSTEGISAGDAVYDMESIPMDELIEMEEADNFPLADGEPVYTGNYTGSGTKEDPYRIDNWDDLYWLCIQAADFNRQIYITLTRDCKPEEQNDRFANLYFREEADVVLDLNGYTLDRNCTEDFNEEQGIGQVIINRSKNLVIMDSSEGGTGLITGGHGGSAGGAIQNVGTLTILGGSISGNSSTVSGGAIYNNGVLRIEGGVITNNSASFHGGGICNVEWDDDKVNLPKVIINGGIITDNEAPVGGGVYNNGDLYINGGEITQNTANYGGGVYCRHSTVTISGDAAIYNNIGLENGTPVDRDVVLGREVTDDGANSLKVDPAYSGTFGIFYDQRYFRIQRHMQVTSSSDTDYQKDLIDTHIFANSSSREGERFGLGYEDGHIYLYKVENMENWMITAEGVDTVYDGKEHGINVTVSDSIKGADLQYALLSKVTDTSNGGDENVPIGRYSDVNPVFTEVGTYRVGYRITAEEYETYTGTQTVIIRPKEITQDDLTVTGVDTIYDGRDHGITVKVSDDIKNARVLYKVISENGEELEVPDSANEEAEESSDSSEDNSSDDSRDDSEDADDESEDSEDTGEDEGDEQSEDEDDKSTRSSGYTEENPAFSEAGTYVVGYIVKADNHISYEGTMEIVIRPKEIHESGMYYAKGDVEIYFDGSAKTPEIIVKDGNSIVSEDEYTVRYSNNIYAGTATVTVSDVKGGNYIISGKKTFVIQPVQIRDFESLRAKITKATNTTQTIRWNQLDDADGYFVYRAKCYKNGKAYAYTLQKDVSADSSSVKMGSLKKGRFYKYYVAAYKIVDGQKIIYKKSMTIHGATKGGNYGTVTRVKINKVGKKKTRNVTIRQGKTAVIDAVEVYGAGKIEQHKTIRYESDNTNVATVNANGKIKAVGKGTCKIYVVAQNGLYKTIKVTVK